MFILFCKMLTTKKSSSGSQRLIRSVITEQHVINTSLGRENGSFRLMSFRTGCYLAVRYGCMEFRAQEKRYCAPPLSKLSLPVVRLTFPAYISTSISAMRKNNQL